MLFESGPIFFDEYDGKIEGFNVNKNNFIELTNLAWKKFYNDLKGYETWEKEVIESINQNIA